MDAVRVEPGADVAAVTAVQIREVVERLTVVGQWRPDNPRAWPSWTQVTTALLSAWPWRSCPAAGRNRPVGLWWPGIGATEVDIDRYRQSLLRRFDIEHTL
ncbi:hypothetical protein AB0C96_41510 [Streptomyces sp. NPDC048506]|uniref:hypothetical protein n=1 Tax=Streptomyces sp. NPDC048506 TaxID=3155028 RepID=UPI003441B563